MREWWQSIQSVFRLIWVHRRRMFHRAGKDSRYGRPLLFAFGASIYIAVYGFYYARNPAAFLLLLPGLAVAIWIGRRNRVEDEAFPTLLTSRPEIQISPLAIDGETEQILLRFFLFRRALSELALHQVPGTDLTNIETRSKVLAEIRSAGLETLWSVEERDLHLLPDGAWSEDSAIGVIARVAEIEALLWASGLQKSLLPVEDLNTVVRLSAKEPLLVESARWRETDELRLQTNLAFEAWLRVVAELRSRGTPTEAIEDEAFLQQLDFVAAQGGHENTDLVLGTRLVTEAEDTELRVARDQLAMRITVLSNLLS